MIHISGEKIMLAVDFVGYSAVHDEGFYYNIGGGHDFYLMVLTASPAQFWVDGQMRTYPANSFILYAPGAYICYSAAKEVYKNDWLRFRTDESFIKDFPLQNVPFSVTDPEYLHSLFKLITWESSFTSANSELILSHLLTSLCFKLQGCLGEGIDANSHASIIIALRKKIYNNPQLPWSVKQMADELHLSAGYLQMLYKNMFGSSCMDDVIEGRLRRAKDQLASSSKSVFDVAEDCGYHNVEHFCRQFRQYIGCSPSQYRKASRLSTAKVSPNHINLGGLELTEQNNP